MSLPFQSIGSSELKPLAELSARAFHTDPFFAYLLPNEALRQRLLSEIMHALMAPLAPLGGTYAYATASAPLGVLCVERAEQRATGLAYVRAFSAAAVRMVTPLVRGGLSLEQLRRLTNGLQTLTQLQGLHPREPHAYVAILTVDPAAQRGGLGRSLLSAFLRECDALPQPVHLETSRPENVGYYERFGFRVVHELRVSDAPALWAMTRPRA